MNYRNLGRTGLKVSPLCMGTMQFGWSVSEPDSYPVLSASYEAGINFFDTADIYSRWVDGNPGGVSETILGNWIKKAGISRENLVIATKVRGKMGDGPNGEGLSRVHIMQAVEASLKRMQIDYVDLYQTHWPDDATPIEETLRALDDLVRQGKVRYVGASNYNAWQLMQALWTSDKHGLARYDSLQPHYNLLGRAEFERELRAVCETYGIGVIPYSPLAGGFLTGKYRKDAELPADSARTSGVQREYFNERGWNVLAAAEKLAAEKSTNVSAIALAWMLADPVITSPIIGPRNLKQLNDNLAALAVTISPEEKAALDQATAWDEK
ncbi:MAG TPA: aldo/keto reductase [Anaerolineae bacterium]|jgi:aryl-alcohol dehydrogenase-like predicted oxidoreductase|nr:aldo/keto reductase [Anaerolineae bacterium]